MTATAIDVDQIKLRHQKLADDYFSTAWGIPDEGAVMDLVLNDVPQLFAEIERLQKYERWWQEMTKGVVMD